jgi:hypothetical protein
MVEASTNLQEVTESFSQLQKFLKNKKITMTMKMGEDIYFLGSTSVLIRY